MNDKQIIICDIDGTIANLQHRLHYIRNPEGTKDWDSFHVTCTDDKGDSSFASTAVAQIAHITLCQTPQ